MILYLSIIYIVFFFIITIITTLTRVKTSKSTIVLSIILLLFSIGGIAYSTVPSTGDDLNRYNILLNELLGRDIDYVVNESAYKNYLLFDFWLYLFSPLKLQAFLPVASSIVFYSICIYVFLKEKKEFKIDSRMFLLFIFLFISCIFLRRVISCIRYLLAFALILLAVYRDFVKDKLDFITVMMYTSTIFIHTCCVPILLIRLFFGKKMKLYKYKACVLLMPILMPLINLSGSNIITTSLQKLELYSSIKIVDIRLFTVKICILIILLVLCNIVKKENKNSKIEIYMNFISTIILMVLGFSFADEFLSRLFELVIMLSLPVIGLCRNIKTDTKKYILKSIFIILPALTSGILMYQLTDAFNNWYFLK